jgi:hypothetical protein
MLIFLLQVYYYHKDRCIQVLHSCQAYSWSWRCEIYYCKSQWKRNKLSIVIFYINFKMKGLKLKSKNIIHLKQRNKRS